MILSRFIIKYEHQNNVAYDAFIEIKMEFYLIFNYKSKPEMMHSHYTTI